MKRLLSLNWLKQFSYIWQKKTLVNCFNNINTVVYQKDNLINFYDLKDNENKLVFSLQNDKLSSPTFVNKEKSKLAFLTKNNDDFWINIYDLEKQNLSRLALENKIENVSIINFDKLNNVYIYYKEQNINMWTIVLANEKETTPIIKNIIYPGLILTRAIEQIENTIVYPQCNKNCQFIFYNLIDKSTKNINITTEDGSPEIFNVEVLFYDEKASKIIYKIPDRNVAYIVEFNGYLWHHIYLEPAKENLIKINGILLDNQGNKKLLASSDYKKQAYIYDINYIGFKLIDLNNQLKVVDNQLNLPESCLLLENKDKQEFWLKDIVTEKEKLILEGKTYLQLF